MMCINNFQSFQLHPLFTVTAEFNYLDHIHYFLLNLSPTVVHIYSVSTVFVDKYINTYVCSTL